MHCINAEKSSKSWLIGVVFGLLSLLYAGAAQAQGNYILEPNTDLGVLMLEAGQTHMWDVEVPAGQSNFDIVLYGGGPRITLDRGDGFPETFDPAEGYIGRGGSASALEIWTVSIEAKPDASAEYTLYLNHAGAADAAANDPFANGSGSMSDDEFFSTFPNEPGFGESGFADQGFGSGFGVQPSALSGFVDSVLAVLSRTVFPYLALFLVQSITIFFVLRSMMKPSNRAAEDEALSEQIASIREARSGAIHFDERRHADEVARFEDDRSRLHRLVKMNAYSRWWMLTIFIVYLIGSSFAHGSVIMSGIFALISLILWLYFIVRARPIGIGFSLFVALVFSAALYIGKNNALLTEPQMMRGLISVGVLLVMLGLLIWRNRYRTSKFPKQDLLVLRVFGMDQSAKETFGTLARGWSFLGASATIADPSYIKYLFSGWRGNVWKFILVTAATLLAGYAYVHPTLSSYVPAGLSEMQAFSLLTVAAFIVLIPVIMVPIFLSVWFSFIKDREKLIAKINKLMGQKKRPNGYHRHKPFFCHDDLWRPAVQRMMAESEVLLMDFRGFDPSNLGCAYEVGKVVNTVDIDKVVLFIDDGTDKDTIYRIFESCWEHRTPDSPNAGKQEPELNVYIGHQFVSWRDGLGRWIWSILTRRRWRRWAEDSRGILARLCTVAPDVAEA